MKKASVIALGSAIVMGAGASSRIGPKPAVALIRRLFDAGARATSAEMEQHAPRRPVVAREGILFGRMREKTRYDLYRPEGVEGPLPTIVWIHGGAWISGGRQDPAHYLKILAAEGYAAVSVDYTLGPEATYPTPVRQVNDALQHLVGNAASLGVDPERLVLAGDSAGAQLASQVAALSVNPALADLLDLKPALRPSQIRATILHCGIYDLRAMAALHGVAAWGFKQALWAYTGTPRWSQTFAGATMSTIDFVTPDFPPTFVSGGNGDALTWIQSVPFASRLRQLGVPTTTLFWAAGHEPSLPHEYQFHLDLPDAGAALAATLEFLGRVTA